MPTVNRKRLLDILDNELSGEEVATLIFDLALDEANVEGAIKHARLRSLIDYYERRDQMDRLIAAVIAIRPDALPPDTVYEAPRIEPPLPGWQALNWQRWLVPGVVIVLVLAGAVVGAQWYQSRPENSGPTIASLTRSIEQQPNNANALFERGELYRDQGDYRLALADYTQVTTLRPYSADAYSRLGLCYEVIGDDDRAIDNYTKAIELQASEWDLLSRGSLYVNKGDLDSGINDFSAAIRRNATFSRPYFERGMAYKLKKDNAKAIADFEQVVDLDNSDIRDLAEEQLKSLAAR